MKSILVIAPHPDDAEYGVGGYIAKCAGVANVTIATMYAGDYPTYTTHVLGEDRKSESLQAAKVLHTRIIHLDVCKDNDYMNYLGELCLAVDMMLDKIRPDVLFIPLPSYNQDHQAVYTACMAATRPVKEILPQKIYAYEYPMQNWGAGAEQHAIMGRTYIPLSNHDMDKKLEALRCYKSQLRKDEVNLSALGGVTALARLRGAECRQVYAELVYLIKNKTEI